MVVALSCIGLLAFSNALTAFDIAVQLLSLPGILGLFGYAYARAFLRLRIWRIWTWLQPLVDAVATVAGFFGVGAFALPGAQPMLESGLEIAFGVALSLPQYIALFRYGYRSQALWERAKR